MSSSRHTPRLDALLDRLAVVLETRGLKANLAREIEREKGISFQAAKNHVHRILARRMLPNGEDTLLLAEWLGKRNDLPPSTPRGRRGDV